MKVRNLSNIKIRLIIGIHIPGQQVAWTMKNMINKYYNTAKISGSDYQA